MPRVSSQHTPRKPTKKTHRLIRALSPQPLNLPIPIHLVILQHRELGLLALMLNLLRRGVHLLLTLLGHTAAQAQHQVQCGLLLDVVVREGAAIFELLPREDEALLVGRDALLVCWTLARLQVVWSRQTHLESCSSHCRWCRRIRPRG